MTSRVLLLDTDVLCHQFAYRNTSSFSWDDDGEQVSVLEPERAKVQVEGYILALMRTTQCKDVVLVLSDALVNFRKQFDPTYKATRVSKPKPELWHVIRTFIESGLMDRRVEIWPRLEGDDVLGILHTGEFKGRSVIASIDKDMNTLPGYLYMPHKPDLGVVLISEYEAARYHLSQVITGDSTDNYPGCPGAGPRKAEELLAAHPRLTDLWKGIVALYKSKGLTEERAVHQARLAYILREGDYIKSRQRIKLWTPDRLASVT